MVVLLMTETTVRGRWSEFVASGLAEFGLVPAMVTVRLHVHVAAGRCAFLPTVATLGASAVVVRASERRADGTRSGHAQLAYDDAVGHRAEAHHLDALGLQVA